MAAKAPITIHIALRLDGERLDGWAHSSEICGDIFVGDRLLDLADIEFEVHEIQMRPKSKKGETP